MNHKLISIDLAKNVFQVCFLNEHGKPTLNKKVTRKKLGETVLQCGSYPIVMEACYSSNYWGRVFQDLGYQVDLIPPHQVKPFVVGNKNDHNDAIAIAEASRRPRATKVAVKTREQQDIQSLNRVRERLLKVRSGQANQIRGLLAEYGIIIKPGIAELRLARSRVTENDTLLTPTARALFDELFDVLSHLDQQIESKDKALQAYLKDSDEYRRLQEVPGIGPVIASSLIGSVGSGVQFKNGRQCAAWVGLTPKQVSSGDKSRMTRISKRGNRSLRRQLVHGARAIVRFAANKDDALSRWIQTLLTTKHINKVVVAVANKLARIAWAILAKGVEYNPSFSTK